MPARERAASTRSQLLIGAAIVLGVLALYTATAARDIVFGDTPELTAVALTLGVAHPPGYPLWTLIAWTFAQGPLGTPPFRVAMVSAVSHAATVGVIYAWTLRSTRSVPAAAVAAVALAVDQIFWAWSLVGEVFGLADLLAALLLFLVTLWHEHPERKHLLVLAGLVGGLGTANHQTMVLVAPAVLYVLWRRRQALLANPLTLPLAAAAVVIGLLPYVELLWAAGRHAVWNWGDLRTFDELVGYVLSGTYGTAALITDEAAVGGSAVARVVTLFTSSDPLQWLLLAAGAVYAIRTTRWYAIYLLIAFLVAGPLFIVYTGLDVSSTFVIAIVERFFLLPRVVAAPLVGFAVLGVGELIERVRITRHDAALPVSAVGLVALIAFVPLRYGIVDESRDRWARTYAEDVLGTLKPRSLLFAHGGTALFPVAYLQTIEQVRSDVVTVGGSLLSQEWYVRELRRSHPDVPIPDDHYGPGGGELATFFEAVRATRPLAASRDISDERSMRSYWSYPRGLVFEIRPLDQAALLDDLYIENSLIIAEYRPPPFAETTSPRRRWERITLIDYASAYYRVGRHHEAAADGFRQTDPARARDLYQTARSWYERALGVHPLLQDALDAMERIEGR